MGKEIRVGLSVVGALLLGFCVLLYARFFRGPSGTPEMNIQLNAEHVATTPTQQRHVRRTPTIVKGGTNDGSAVSPVERMENPRQTQSGPDESLDELNDGDRERHFLPIAPRPLGDDFVSTKRRPDAIAPPSTMTVTIGRGEDLRRLAQRVYGVPNFERALWQWLFDRDLVESLQPGATLELPTRAALQRAYPRLIVE